MTRRTSSASPRTKTTSPTSGRGRTDDRRGRGAGDHRVRLLITGGLGLLGKEIAQVFEGSAAIRTTDREEWDVTDPAACRREVDGFRPDVVIHCAAYTAVDRAESEPERTRLLNVEGTRNVCLLYTSDAADDLLCVDLGGRRIIK